MQNRTVTRRQFTAGLAAASALAGPLAGSLAGRLHAAEAKDLRYHTKVPANAEPRLDDLVQSWLTPTKHFYIRSHAPVPNVDVDAYRLSVEGLVHKPLSLSLNELRDLADTEVVATLTCAGNRRSEHSDIKHVAGVPWNEGAIGNARWKGVKLSALLKRAGVKENARHVWFDGLDSIPKGGETIAFGGSIPLAKAMLDTRAMPGALITTQMNGAPLPPDHGFPVRAVVPGYIGARSVKWLGRIVVSDHPSLNHYVENAYKLSPEADDLRLAEAAPIYSYRTNSVICTPQAGAKLKAGKVQIAGYALPAGEPGTAIARVEVSTDGRRWTAAALDERAHPYCWRLWRATLQLEPGTKQIVVRALDSRGHWQPRHVDWNYKGYLFNAWHRVPVSVT